MDEARPVTELTVRVCNGVVEQPLRSAGEFGVLRASAR